MGCYLRGLSSGMLSKGVVIWMLSCGMLTYVGLPSGILKWGGGSG
jgi:hypothetical protein